MVHQFIDTSQSKTPFSTKDTKEVVLFVRSCEEKRKADRQVAAFAFQPVTLFFYGAHAWKNVEEESLLGWRLQKMREWCFLSKKVYQKRFGLESVGYRIVRGNYLFGVYEKEQSARTAWDEHVIGVSAENAHLYYSQPTGCV